MVSVPLSLRAVAVLCLATSVRAGRCKPSSRTTIASSSSTISSVVPSSSSENFSVSSASSSTSAAETPSSSSSELFSSSSVVASPLSSPASSSTVPITSSSAIPTPPLCSPTSTVVPETCWAAIPTACSSLNRTPSIPWPAVTVAATNCRNAFVVGTETVAASCFSSVNSPQFSALSAYGCISNAPIYCTAVPTSVCADPADPTVIPTSSPEPGNGGFENGALDPDWTINSSSGTDDIISTSVSTEVVRSGQYALKVAFSNANGGSRTYIQFVRLEPGAAHELSWWWYSTNAAASTTSRFQLLVSGESFLTDGATRNGPTGVWTKQTFTFTPKASVVRVLFTVYGNRQEAANTFYVDDILFRKL
ncbi:hypothetical protein B0H66DRAFT_571139 [Apodospora peruviana]|uniref:CBM-cenC domain-containing protein n=1 Tax=Apodospora peruviana TaxID=516989 RepID=A0AAE0LY40_9PEZI|nr:hypothetical protein B0H66DRAFT_571139 [Apodospora peruviana]